MHGERRRSRDGCGRRGVAKSAPPVVVSGMTLAGYSLNDWVLAATLMWIAVQMGWFIWSNIIKPRRQQGGAE